ncbi:MAG TPA: FAD-dependent oxidoreductase [Pyrinomonadaceae bacterium]|nr:FAD-dependent oxidoreductase [Pyrinomonadaceae bacterium]
MANILVLGGGFGGVVAAEALAKDLGREHQITLISRDTRFTFYPALVRLAFGGCEPDDISYDIQEAMLDRRVRFIKSEVARVDPYERRVRLAHGDVVGQVPYDYLIYALGRRLATELVPGFFEHAHHLLNVEAALKFGEAAKDFSKGQAVIGYCPGTRLAVPVYETAFALSRMLEERGQREHTTITIISPEPASDRLGGRVMGKALRDALDAHYIAFMPEFPISRVTSDYVWTSSGMRYGFDLLMLVPPFHGASAFNHHELIDEDGFIRVDRRMRVQGVERMYAVGDAVSFEGPKMGHMAVRQAEVAAANLIAEIEGREPHRTYEHELMLVIDEGGPNSIYLHKELWKDDPGTVRQGRFWQWAKWAHEKYWEYQHS